MVTSGSYPIGPETGTLRLRTHRQGAASRAGHDLLIEVTRWSGTVEVDAENPDRSRVEVTADPTSFDVLEGTGGLKPLTDKDRGEIKETAATKILDAARHPEITFASTAVSATGDEATVRGDLTVRGTSRPTEVRATVADTRVTAVATVVQTEFGIKPYTAFLGALKLRDDVDVQVELTLQ